MCWVCSEEQCPPHSPSPLCSGCGHLQSNRCWGNGEGRAAPSLNAEWVHLQLMIKVLCLCRRVFQLSERLKYLWAEDWQEGAQGLLKRRKEGSQKASLAPYHGIEIQRFPVLPGTGDSHYLHVFCKMRSWKQMTDYLHWSFNRLPLLFTLFPLFLWQTLVYAFEVLLSVHIDPVFKHF